MFLKSSSCFIRVNDVKASSCLRLPDITRDFKIRSELPDGIIDGSGAPKNIENELFNKPDTNKYFHKLINYSLGID